MEPYPKTCFRLKCSAAALIIAIIVYRIGKGAYRLNEELRSCIAQKGLTYHIETYGCQMNAHESEKAAGLLEALGFSSAPKKSEADLILFNTCCVREHAEARLSGNVGALKEYKQTRPGALIAIWGCMMQQPGAAQKLAARFPFVDIVFGTNQLHHLEEMLTSALLDGKRVVMAEPDETIIEGMPARRSGASAFVNIIYGCNNFCTYCIVPYVRGRERSRRSADIIKEIDALCESGVTEVTLLGQNVNSYGKDLSGDLSFPELIRSIDKNTGVKRLRFMTSHPKDLTDELIECYGSAECLCEHIHLPVQSGSSRILAAMKPSLYARALSGSGQQAARTRAGRSESRRILSSDSRGKRKKTLKKHFRLCGRRASTPPTRSHTRGAR